MIHILVVITDLKTGGAEMMLYKLLSNYDKNNFSYSVISLMDHGDLGTKIVSLGVPVYTIDMREGRPSVLKLFKIIKLIQKIKPDLIQGWMYHGNIAATLSNFFISGRKPVIWNIRGTHTNLRLESILSACTIWLGARLSNLPYKIINNSRSSASSHENQLGYASNKWKFIPNGFDTNLFTPSNSARICLRKELGLSVDALIIGHVGRFHPVKDYSGLLKASSLLNEKKPDVHFVLVGENVDISNIELTQEIHSLSLQGYVHLLGQRTDIPSLTAAFDIATLSSLSEGFPNVIGEAMSCGVPCVVTDAGDSPWIVGETGRVVPPGDAEALSNAWSAMIDLGADGRNALGALARQRVIDNFSLASVVRQYEALYEEVLMQKKRSN